MKIEYDGVKINKKNKVRSTYIQLTYRKEKRNFMF